MHKVWQHIGRYMRRYIHRKGGWKKTRICPSLPDPVSLTQPPDPVSLTQSPDPVSLSQSPHLWEGVRVGGRQGRDGGRIGGRIGGRGGGKDGGMEVCPS